MTFALILHTALSLLTLVGLVILVARGVRSVLAEAWRDDEPVAAAPTHVRIIPNERTSP